MSEEVSETQVNGHSSTGFVVPMGRKVRVWGEVTVRIGVGEGGYDFVRYTFGSERLVVNNPGAISKAEKAIHSYNLDVVESRVGDYRDLIEDMKRT